MSEELNLDITELRRQRSQQGGHSDHQQNGERPGARGHARSGSTRVTGTGAPVSSNATAEGASTPIDFWRVLEVLARRWMWVLTATALCGAAAFLVGLAITSYTAKVSLIRRENPNAFTAGSGENVGPQAYISRELSAQTLFGLMRSPEVFRRVGEKANPPVRPERLAKAVKVIPERNPDFVTLSVSGKEAKEVLAEWANLFADEVVAFTRQLQATEAGSISEFLALKVKGVQNELAHINDLMVRFSEEAQTLDVDKEVEAYTSQVVAMETKYNSARIELETIDYQISNFRKALAEQTPENNRLQAAQEELERLRMRGYTEMHPQVISQKAVVEALAKQSGSPANNTAEIRMPGGSLASAIQLRILELQSLKEVRNREIKEYEAVKARIQEKAKTLSRTAVEYAQLKSGQKRLEDLRITLLSKQQEAQLLKENALGYFKVFSYASPQEVSGRKRLFALILLAGVGGLLGMLAGCGLALIAEAMDRRLKTASDLERVTQLPVLATLGDLRTMTPEEQINWAFRTLTLLQGKLNASSDETLVCGFISSRHGEGRSTWIDLLVSAASQRGMRVLTVATRSSTSSADSGEDSGTPKQPGLLPAGPATTLTKSVLASPAQVLEQFSDPQAQPVVHIPLPGWVWNLERRQQWRTALNHWQVIDNLVLFIELPPACEPESVLLAEHLPQVIWLASSGMAEIEETRVQLETLRHARCNLVGAVLNREPTSFFRRHFSKWSRRLGVWLACGVLTGQAAEPSPNPADAEAPGARPGHGSFSVLTPTKRAPWQERLTLGPGDAFDVSVFGHPELTRTNVVIGPDGRVNYLQVQDLPASGLTVDELRARLEAELGNYYVGGVRTMVVPTSFNSKKYFMLGKVVTEGAFTLDRPLTIIEAVARAKGLRTETSERGAAEVADLSRSFLAREGKRMPVDFERLFREGDLSQNIPIAPNDYLYFAPAGAREIYVLGEVLSPGRVVATSDASVVAAVTARGGFTLRAYQKRVLVIRGSLQRPQGYAIDTPAILAGRTPDFKLEPQDIVYVNVRPWIRIEELLDIAAQAFIESAVTVWAGAYVPAVFVRPIIPHP